MCCFNIDKSKQKISNNLLIISCGIDGYNSLINFSNNQEIVIINSLSKDYLALRSTLLQNLIKLKQENSIKLKT